MKRVVGDPFKKGVEQGPQVSAIYIYVSLSQETSIPGMTDENLINFCFAMPISD